MAAPRERIQNLSLDSILTIRTIYWLTGRVFHRENDRTLTYPLSALIDYLSSRNSRTRLSEKSERRPYL